MKQITPFLIIGLMLGFAAIAMAHPDLDEYEGAGTCAGCHSGFIFDAQTVAENFLTTVHGAFGTEVTEDFGIFTQEEDPVTGFYGKTNRYCGLPGSITHVNWIGRFQGNNPNTPGGLPGGCVRCHPSDGSFETNNIPGDAWGRIDCMICHAETYIVNGTEIVNAGARQPVSDASSPTGWRLALPTGDDLQTTSGSIDAQVTTNACQRCHLYAGGGYMNKRGHDFVQDDVHTAALECIDCHQVDNHKIAMGHTKPALWTNEMTGQPVNDEVSCAYCHIETGSGPTPEHNGFPSVHFDKIACETCHIPTVKGMTEKHFDDIVQVLSNNLFMQWTFAATNIDPENPAIPDYHWYNGTVYDNVSPRGTMEDGKIYPWKTLRAMVPEDVATGIMLPLKLGKVFGADSSLSNYGGDESACVDDAIRTGVQLAASAQPDQYGELAPGGTYSGTYEWVWDEMIMAINHGVKPAEEANTCFDCHAEGAGIWDWQDLGYGENPYPMAVKEVPGKITPDRFNLEQNYPNPFNPTTTLAFSLPHSEWVTLRVFDVNGREVAKLVDDWYQGGSYETTFDADFLASGIYFARFEAGDVVQTHKMMLIK